MTQKFHDVVLAIAGSDSGGCAGIQADIKSISANGAFASSAITAITAQNTLGVQHIFPLPLSTIVAQIRSVLSDIEVQSIKIGMLHSVEVIEAVQDVLSEYETIPMVIDPVMVAASGDRLINDDAVHALQAFLPKAMLVTPNIPEAQILLEGATINKETMSKDARQLGKMYRTSVLLKGGHLQTKSAMCDVLYLYSEDRHIVFKSEYVNTKNTHGTGCTLSSAIAAHIAQGKNLEHACGAAHEYLASAIKAGAHIQLGKGAGPVHHFH